MPCDLGVCLRGLDNGADGVFDCALKLTNTTRNNEKLSSSIQREEWKKKKPQMTTNGGQ